MRNQDSWEPTKFVYKRGRLLSSRDSREVAVGSRLSADIVASLYESYIPKYAKGRLADLGCGRVPLFAAYKDYVEDNVCVDWHNTLHGKEYLDHECDLTEELPFSEGEFDTIILSSVLEHVPEPEKLWREMARILRPGGTALINVPFYYWLHEVPHDYYRYSGYALRRFAEVSGFRVLVLKPTGGTPEILADMLAKHSQSVPVIGSALAISTQYITAAFLRTAAGRRFSEKTSRFFPLGYFLVVEKRRPLEAEAECRKRPA